MEIRQVQYFLTIVKAGSFSSAAELLYISQSSLSKQILALESELGVQLFDRSKRKITLTEAGETFLKHAPRLNAAYKSMWTDVEEFRLKKETLSIVAIPVIAQYGITGYLAQFAQQYPHIQLALEEREAATILPTLNDHQYDLAVIRDNYVDRAQYACLEVCTDKLLAVVSQKHYCARRRSISLKELANENFIMFDKGTIVHEICVDACVKAGFEPRIFYSSLRIDSILGLVASNIGIALMMEKVFDYFKHPDVVGIPLDEVVESKIIIAALKDKKLSESAEIFIESIRKALLCNE
jgi:LysR family transcriptional activator of glutamate synthase operon